jgi:hypothetical protein
MLRWESLLVEFECGNSRSVFLFRELHNMLWSFEKTVIEAVDYDLFCMGILGNCRRDPNESKIPELVLQFDGRLKKLDKNGFSNIEIYSNSIREQLKAILADQSSSLLEVI